MTAVILGSNWVNWVKTMFGGVSKLRYTRYVVGMVEREIKYRSLKIASQWFGGAVEMCAKPWWGLLEITLRTSFLAINHLALRSPLIV